MSEKPQIKLIIKCVDGGTGFEGTVEPRLARIISSHMIGLIEEDFLCKQRELEAARAASTEKSV